MPTLLLLGFAGCAERDSRSVITIWHQSRPSEKRLLEDEVKRFEAAHPNVRVRTLYKETEELRSGFQAAALAGGGPELIFGPSDVLGALQTMGVVQDMSRWFPAEKTDDFVDGALTYLPRPRDNRREGEAPAEPGQGGSAGALPSRPQMDLVQVADRFGNHLALVYNKKFIPHPPKTTDELIELAVKNTLDENGDGRKERYGLVWSFKEPFFGVPFLTGYGGWVFEGPAASPTPTLETPQAVEGWRFMQDLQTRYGVAPQDCDYETADSLFKSGKAAMIINGDWSWAEYLATPGIDVAVAVLPTVTATGKPMGTMYSPKGYSLNVNASPEAAEIAMSFVRHMVSDDVEHRIVSQLKMLPARKSIQNDPLLQSDETLKASVAQLKNGRLMPTATELRAVWDGMRPSYQSLLAGKSTPEKAAAEMQRETLAKIAQIRSDARPDRSARILQVACLVLLAGLIYWQRNSFAQLVHDWRRNRLAYLLVLPSIICVFAVIIFPFFYNIVLSLSNMSLANFRDWQVIGLQNYLEVFTDPTIGWVFLKTIVWTAVNIFFHVSLGVLLAVALNGPVRGKSLYRILLIIPWAVPAYITALTWRGMFDYEYGAVNLMLSRYLGIAPVNWLGDVWHAFEACIVANVWLGFPFMMVIALGGMQGIPHELYEAARIDRASRWQQFWHITLPLLKPVLLPAVTLGTIWTFNNLNVIWLVSNAGEPEDKTNILVSYVYKSAFNFYRYGYAAALSMVIFFVLLVFSVLFLKRTKATESVYG